MPAGVGIKLCLKAGAAWVDVDRSIKHAKMIRPVLNNPTPSKPLFGPI